MTAAPGARFDFSRSVSQRRLYAECGTKYVLRYGQNWKTKLRKGRFEFGNVMERLADLTLVYGLKADDAEGVFRAAWAPYKADATYSWSKRHSWDFLNARGAALARVMARDLPARLRPPYVVQLEARFDLSSTIGAGVATPGSRELVYPDMLCFAKKHVGMLWGEDEFVPSYVDFKTADRRYPETAAELDAQLTAGQLADQACGYQLGRPVEQLGFVVLLFGAEPAIQWVMAPARDDQVLATFRHDAVLTDGLIRAGVFTRNDKKCHEWGGCEYQPLCFPSLAGQRDALLMQDRTPVVEGPDLAAGWEDE